MRIGGQPAARPGSNLPGARGRELNPENIGQDRDIPRDTARDNIEGARHAAPPEFRDRVAGYNSRLARIRASGRRAARAQPAGQK